jgi:hypothetical protein
MMYPKILHPAPRIRLIRRSWRKAGQEGKRVWCAKNTEPQTRAVWVGHVDRDPLFCGCGWGQLSVLKTGRLLGTESKIFTSRSSTSI